MVQHRICPHCGKEILPKRFEKPEPRKTGTFKHFDKFWEEYPRKVAERVAKREWKKKHLDKRYKVVLRALAKQKEAGLFILTDKMRGCPLASTWIEKELWKGPVAVKNSLWENEK